MTLYRYTAKNVSGASVSDIVDADTPKAAALKIQALGLYPVTIREPEDKTGFRRFSLPGFARIRSGEITLFTCRLADLLHAGMPLVRSLGVLERQTKNAALKEILAACCGEIQGGRAFSETLQKYPDLFPQIYTGMVRAGEYAGLLEAVLRRLAEFREKEEELKHRLQSALTYPAVMLLMGFVSIIFLLVFVIPRFEIMFADIGQQLPLPTRILVLAGLILKNYWYIYIPAAAAGAFFLRRYMQSDAGKSASGRLFLRIPLTGGILGKELAARFARMLAALLANGVPLLEALAMVKSSTGNALVSEEITSISESVREGRGIVAPLRRSVFFPPLAADIVAIGEETGNLEGALNRMADVYQREVDYSLKTLTSLVEPLIILAIGLLIGFVAMALLLPVFQISSGTH